MSEFVDPFEEVVEGKKGEESSTSGELDLDSAFALGYAGASCETAPADPRTLAWARGVWQRQAEQTAATSSPRGIPSLAVAGRETKEAKQLQTKNGGCPFDTPRGTRCKACGKVHV